MEGYVDRLQAAAVKPVMNVLMEGICLSFLETSHCKDIYIAVVPRKDFNGIYLKSRGK